VSAVYAELHEDGADAMRFTQVRARGGQVIQREEHRQGEHLQDSLFSSADVSRARYRARGGWCPWTATHRPVRLIRLPSALSADPRPAPEWMTMEPSCVSQLLEQRSQFTHP
jgi:hypothetical protein